MLDVHIEKIGELVVVECEGRVVQNDAAFTLWEAVTSQRNARIIVLDLSEVRAVEGGDLGMLVFLQRWAHDHDIRFKLFNPTKSCASRRNRSSACGSWATSSGRNFRATKRPRSVSSAL